MQWVSRGNGSGWGSAVQWDGGGSLLLLKVTGLTKLVDR